MISNRPKTRRTIITTTPTTAGERRATLETDFFHRLCRAIFFLAVALFPVHQGGVHLWSFSICAAVAAAALALGVVRSHGKYGSAVPPNVFRYIFVYAALFALASIRAFYPWGASVEAFRLTAAVMVFSGTVFYCGDRQGVRDFALIIAFVAGALSFASLLMYLGGLPHGWWRPYDFPASVYVNHNHFAGYLELTLPLTLGALLAESSLGKRTILALSGILSLLALLFSFSRGAYVAIVLAMAFQFYWLVRFEIVKQKRAVIALWIAALFAAAGLFGTKPVVERVQAFSGAWSGEASWLQRLQIWQGAFGQIAQNLWLGTGPGSFEFAALEFRTLGLAGRAVYAHNDYLHALAELGLFGFAAAIVLWRTLFWRGLSLLKKGKSDFRIGVVSGALASLTALALHSLIDFNFHLPANFMHVAVLAGLILSFETTSQMAHLAPPPVVRRKMANLGLVALVLFMAFYFGRPDYDVWRVRTGRVESPEISRELAAGASKANPSNPEAFYQMALAESAMGRHGDADKNFARAARLNPREPYFDFQRAKNLLAGGHETACQPAAESLRNAVAKDPRDPRILYLAGKAMLGCSAVSPSYERRGIELLARAVRADAWYAGPAAEAIWAESPDIEALRRFFALAPSAGDGILKFLDHKELWRHYRSFLLLTRGINTSWREKTLRSERWAVAAEPTIYRMKDLEERADELPIRDGEFFYRNGEIGVDIDFKTHFNRLVLHARGTSALGSYPLLLVKIDDKVEDAIYVDSFPPTAFYALVRVRPGKHRLSLEFVNDAGDGRMDRNVWIEGFRVDSDGVKNPMDGS